MQYLAKGHDALDLAKLSKGSKAISIGSRLLDRVSGLKNWVSRSADELNAALKAVNPKWKSAYKVGTQVIEFETSKAEKYVRVFGEGSMAEGKWMMKADDIKGLSPKQIQNKFALPFEPTDITNVTVPKGTMMRFGEAAPVKGWGNGGGMQFELLNDIPKSSFSKSTPLIK